MIGSNRFSARATGQTGRTLFTTTRTAFLAGASLVLLGGCPPAGPGGAGGPGPDLSAALTSAPPSATPGAPIELAAQVCNAGDAWTPPTELRFALQPDSGAVGWFEDRGVPALESGECFAETATAFAPVDGVYTAVVVADPRLEIDEPDEANNADTGVAMGVGYGPDFVVHVKSAPASTLPFVPFTADVEVCNRGTQSGAGPWVGLYVSVDDTIEHIGGPGGDELVGGLPAPPLPPGACTTLALDGVAGGLAGPGAYTVGAIADPDAFEPELIEDNNAHAGPRIGIGSDPNLVVDAIGHPPSALPGSALALDVRVCNDGTTPSGPASVQIGLSPDAQWTSPAEDPASLDREIAWLPVAPLDPGACESVATEAPAFIGGEDGAYHLIAIVDPLNDQPELIEDDNTLAAGPVGVGSAPDWVVTAIDAPTSALPGASFDATVRVCNQGTVPTGGGHVLLLFSSDGSVPPGPPPGGAGAVTPGPLQPGACGDFVAPLFAHPPQGDGAYVLVAVADEGDADPELIESNNVFAGPVMGIGNGPDWIVESLTLPPSVEPGQVFDVGARVCNQGTQPAPPTDVTFYLSEDAQIEGVIAGGAPPDFFVVALPVAPLDPGSCANVSDVAPPTAPLESGAYHAGALVDESDFAFELNETNNALVGSVLGVGTDPDLVVASVSGPASAQLGAFVDFDFQVCNQGTRPSTPTDVAVVLAAGPDPAAGPGPPGPAAWAPVPPLAAGACHSGVASGSAAPLHGEGVSYPHAFVDAGDVVPELIEDNNAAAGPAIGIGSAPDLRVASLDAPPSAAPGNPVPVDVEICNDGTTPSPPTDALLVLSADAVIESPLANPFTEDVPVAPVPVPPLAPGECQTSGVQAFLFPPGGDGAYHLGAIVDESDSVQELIEGNNTFDGGLIGVGFGPDLRIGNVVAPAGVTPGIGFDVDVEICNDGTLVSPAHDVALLLSEDPDIAYPPSGPGPPMVWELVAYGPVPPVGEGACTTVALPATTFLPAGSYAAVALADAGAYVDELREDNNRDADTAVQVAP